MCVCSSEVTDSSVNDRAMAIDQVMVDVYAKRNLVAQIVPIVKRVILNPLIEIIK